MLPIEKPIVKTATATSPEGAQLALVVEVIDGSDEHGRFVWLRARPRDFVEVDFSELRAIEVAPNVWQISAVETRPPKRRRTGIATALVQLVKAHTLGIVESSSNRVKRLGTEYRTEPATKMWEGMKGRDEATYDETLDRFTLL